ncbi:hypothetical protein BDP81DRAFT_81213 [Colletotrichum phormii]|uniref:Secreted protein n=1 Tax=Colletotrichum phormii TaxID=359342 RepID=A0AAJ0EJQ7_9PEZI|nr:uncharacterized protein BDP81DRAFT_81213 [Colletotrichum phormii]KAK1654316.1 hypothetical protein BDP81DRAFT_81213 [Colletotrichum phormii]
MTLVSPASVFTQLLFLALTFIIRPDHNFRGPHATPRHSKSQDRTAKLTHSGTGTSYGARTRTFGFCVAFFNSMGNFLFFLQRLFSGFGFIRKGKKTRIQIRPQRCVTKTRKSVLT